jgi:hypothetical protein
MTITSNDYPKFIDIRTAPGSKKKLMKPSGDGLPMLTKKIILSLDPRLTSIEGKFEYKTY